MKQLFIIRIALLFGVGMFAALTVYMRTSGNLPDADAAGLEKVAVLRYAVWGLAAFSVLWALFWKTRAESAQTEQGVSQAMIVGWAPGEATALMGTATYFVGGPIATMAFGLLAFVVVLLVLRIPGGRS